MVCPKLAEGDIIRYTRVDECGRPVEGVGNAFVDECWASLAMAPNVEDGEDIDFPAANGRSCGFKKGCPTFRGFDITGNFYSASPQLIDIMTANELVLGWDDEPIGWDDGDISCRQGFGLEIWQNILGEECPTVGDGLWFYWLLPWVSNGKLGDVEVNNGGVTFELTGNTRAGGGWSLGPWDVQAQDGSNTAGPLLVPLGATAHRRAFLTTIAPPEPSCDYVTVPANNFPTS